MDKAKRYDRGIRIWGAHGQDALESACICLLNCGPTGSEALKNLVLGGIRSFTIVDGNKVEAADLGNNFLVTGADLGRQRGQCVTGVCAGMYVCMCTCAGHASSKQFLAMLSLWPAHLCAHLRQSICPSSRPRTCACPVPPSSPTWPSHAAPHPAHMLASPSLPTHTPHAPRPPSPFNRGPEGAE